VHIAVDTLGHLLAVLVTPANAQDRHQVNAEAQEYLSALYFNGKGVSKNYGKAPSGGTEPPRRSLL
jgi:TPR repeat protein